MWTPLISFCTAFNARKGSWGNFVLEKEGSPVESRVMEEEC